MKTKQILKYLENGDYCVAVPVYYDLYKRPATRILFIGSLSDCKTYFKTAPDRMNATNGENADLLKGAIKEYLFIKELPNKKTLLNNFFELIKPQYYYLFKGDI